MPSTWQNQLMGSSALFRLRKLEYFRPEEHHAENTMLAMYGIFLFYGAQQEAESLGRQWSQLAFNLKMLVQLLQFKLHVQKFSPCCQTASLAEDRVFKHVSLCGTLYIKTITPPKGGLGSSECHTSVLPGRDERLIPFSVCFCHFFPWPYSYQNSRKSESHLEVLSFINKII